MAHQSLKMNRLCFLGVFWIVFGVRIWSGSVWAQDESEGVILIDAFKGKLQIDGKEVTAGQMISSGENQKEIKIDVGAQSWISLFETKTCQRIFLKGEGRFSVTDLVVRDQAGQSIQGTPLKICKKDKGNAIALAQLLKEAGTVVFRTVPTEQKDTSDFVIYGLPGSVSDERPNLGVILPKGYEKVMLNFLDEERKTIWKQEVTAPGGMVSFPADAPSLLPEKNYTIEMENAGKFYRVWLRTLSVEERNTLKQWRQEMEQINSGQTEPSLLYAATLDEWGLAVDLLLYCRSIASSIQSDPSSTWHRICWNRGVPAELRQ